MDDRKSEKINLAFDNQAEENRQKALVIDSQDLLNNSDGINIDSDDLPDQDRSILNVTDDGKLDLNSEDLEETAGVSFGIRSRSTGAGARGNRTVYIQRSPRIQPPLLAEEVEVPRPPHAPMEPSSAGIVEIIFPLGMIIIAVVISIAMDNPTMLYYMVPMAFLTLFGLVIRNSSQKKKYFETEKIRTEKYTRALESVWHELSKVREYYKVTLLEVNPHPGECQRRVVTRDRRLWERSPADSDFLELRLGLGSVPFPVKVKYPPQEITIKDDPLLLEAHKGEERFRSVEGVPICFHLKKGGTIGFVGSRDSVLQNTRAMLTQIAIHHAYNEVKIVAVHNSAESREWNWLRSLPHTADNSRKQRFLASNREQAQQLLAAFYDLIRKRELLAAGHGENQAKLNLPHLVFVIADRSLVENEQILRYLLHNNQSLGISSIFLFDYIENLPADCTYIVNIRGKEGQIISRLGNMQNVVFSADIMPANRADYMAGEMAPLRLQQLFPTDELPENISLLELLDVNNIDQLNIPGRWSNSKAYNTLSTLIGVRAGNEKISLDIHDKSHGPHGLIAGTTGSGKSELLQSLILSLAVNYHPHDVMFVLIDYKGGGMANVFKGLPHLAGIITNLSGNQTSRALLSVKSELHRRQSLFDRAGVNHIDKYIKLNKQGRTDEVIPHLVIVVDEFAELKSEQPDFMRELVSAARVGRSLGVHLILATQKPAGVVDEQIWSNARFKICLKVQNTGDSQEMLKRPDASMITLPGRAYLQVGNNELFELFQSAYSGAAYYISHPGYSDGQKLVVDLGDTLDFGTLYPASWQREDAPSQLNALVEYMQKLAVQENVQALQDQWLPPLPETIVLQELNYTYSWNGAQWQKSTSWLSPVVGLVDSPASQAQFPLQIDLGREGHLAVYGAPGSGKTTFIQTIVISLVMNHNPEEVNLYVLDFGGRTLSVFAALPHVGSVITVDDEEKLKKLVRMLIKELDRRKRLFGVKSVGSLSAYRETGDQSLPAIVVVVDNYPALYELYPETEDLFINLSREGGNLGLHLIIAAGGVTSIQYKVASNIKMMLALQLADKGDYSTVVGRTGGLEPEAVVGRGLIKSNPPLEFQTALAVHGDSEAERASALNRLIQAMNHKWQGKRAKPVPVLPEMLKQKDLLSDERVIENIASDPYKIALGLDTEELEPIYLNIIDSPHILVAGKLKCGKTTFLKSLFAALTERFSPDELKIFIVDAYAMGLHSLRNQPHIEGYAGNQPQLTDIFERLTAMIEKQRTAIADMRASAGSAENANEVDILACQPRLVLMIDDFNDFMQMAEPAVKDVLEKLIARERSVKFNLVTAALISDISSNWEPLAKTIKDCQSGLLMAEALDQQVFNIRVSYSEGGIPLQPGEGYFVNRGQHKKIKVAMV